MNGIIVTAALVALVCLTAQAVAEPLRLHPSNPHYFLFRGKPTVLIGSGEHYGAVLNLDFDYVKYLDELKRCRLNHTRTFSGVYCEPYGAFGIEKNTLAPAPGRYCAPWLRSGPPGAADGGPKWDLTRFDPAYFTRLKDFFTQASRRGVVVEFNLFCPFYGDAMWRLSPMNAANNVNGIGKVARTDVYTLDRNGGLLSVQEDFVRKVVTELNGFDNLYYEICNEPYFGGVTMEWQRRIADVIVETERSLRNRHLISMNIANGSAKVTDPHPAVSILNFHYASPPDAVAANYHLNRVIGDNETGFKGTSDAVYRMEAWEFLLAGGGLFSHLDYSFAVGHEDGTFAYPPKQPGGGGAAFRRQMQILRWFMESLDFVRMKPLQPAIEGLPAAVRARVLGQEGREYAFYLWGKGAQKIRMELPKGRWEIRVTDPVSGETLLRRTWSHPGGPADLSLPPYGEDLAFRLRLSRR